MRTDAGKAELVGQAKQLIGKVASDFYRDLLTETLAHRLGRTTSEIERLLPAKEQTASRKDAPKRDKMTPVSRAIVLAHSAPAIGSISPGA